MKRVPYFDIQDDGVPYLVYQLLFALRDYFENENHSIMEISPEDLDFASWPPEQVGRVQICLLQRLMNANQSFKMSHFVDGHAIVSGSQPTPTVSAAMAALRCWLQLEGCNLKSDSILVAIWW